MAIEEGKFDDYRALSGFHYRAGTPATLDRILRLVDREANEPVLAGVLVVSFPALYGVCRARAWPDRFAGIDYRDAHRINGLLRTISRVIIEPRYRGLGAASGLVRAYLADPSTPLTEAITAMGRFCPFFEAAGMTPHEVPRAERDVRLCLMLRKRGIAAWRLLDAGVARRAIADREVAQTLRVWARRGGCGARRAKRMGLMEVAQLAGAALTARPVMYSHGT
ncbi:MAG: hypothetical protein IT435_00380 [Phycisphaerales bacterium]|nr:hypothetical protein [Phycisphaerales bacterium]